MNGRMTERFLVKYAAVARQASYLDKKSSLLGESNPYYVLEWLLLPPSKEELERLSSIDYARSPGLDRKKQIPFLQVFFSQTVPDLAFSVSNRLAFALRRSALADLRRLFGESAWTEASGRLVSRLQETLSLWSRFQQTWAELTKEAEEEFARKRKELLQEEAEQPKEVMEEQLQRLQETRNERINAIPKELLSGPFAEEPLLALFYYKNWETPSSYVEGFIEAIRHAGVDPYAAAAEQSEPESLVEWEAQERKTFLDWAAGYFSETDLNRAKLDMQEKQRVWARWLERLPELAKTNRVLAEELIQTTVNIHGAERLFVEDGTSAPWLPAFIRTLLEGDERRAQELALFVRDRIILKQWPIFAEKLLSPAISKEKHIWVFCLDPVSIEQRLLRSSAAKAGPAAMIEALCEAYAFGLKTGLPFRWLEPHLAYLCDKEPGVITTFPFKVSSFAELSPVLSVDAALLTPVFKREAAAPARRKIAELLVQHMAAGADHVDQQEKKAARLLASEKPDMVKLWLERYGREPDMLPKASWERAARTLDVKWLGFALPGKEAEHAQVLKWLETNSEWISFEGDASPSSGGGSTKVSYRILAPGVLDAAGGRLLARVKVRAELADQQEIRSLLDDLADL
ncbi:hypothetical protein [Paenibacillus turpanensis]|uniref:hypothetical protein n=1 Tax=Paenibacillus turpanensis TaxID=2689078 RepID=UPI00140E961C|nr:hypothetical protein [Paenibacillus turpanensis]